MMVDGKMFEIMLREDTYGPLRLSKEGTMVKTKETEVSSSEEEKRYNMDGSQEEGEIDQSLNPLSDGHHSENQFEGTGKDSDSSKSRERQFQVN